MTAPYATLAEPLSSETARSGDRNCWKNVVPVAFLFGFGCAAFWNQSDHSNVELSEISMSALARPGAFSQSMVRSRPAASVWQPTITKKSEQFLQPVRAEAVARKEKTKQDIEAMESGFKTLLDKAPLLVVEVPSVADGITHEPELSSPWTAKKYLSVVDRGLTMLTGDEALKLVKEDGAVIVDVRPESAFKKKTAKGAINIPLFKEVTGNSLEDNRKKFVSLLFKGGPANEKNTDFGRLALERLPRDKPILIICNKGGSLDLTRYDPSAGQIMLGKKGPVITDDVDQYTSSIMAAFELFENGFTNLYALQSGMRKWPGELA